MDKTWGTHQGTANKQATSTMTHKKKIFQIA